MGSGGINSFQKQKRKQRRKAWVMSTKQAAPLHVAACNVSTGNAVLHRMLLACWSAVPWDRHTIPRRNQQKALLWLYIDVCPTRNCYSMSDLSTVGKKTVESQGFANITVQIHIPLPMATNERTEPDILAISASKRMSCCVNPYSYPDHQNIQSVHNPLIIFQENTWVIWFIHLC